MPSIRRRRKERREITDAQRCHLQCGHDYFGSGWRCASYDHCICGRCNVADFPAVLEEMREAWDAVGEEVQAAWFERFPGQLCWAFEQFGPPRG